MQLRLAAFLFVLAATSCRTEDAFPDIAVDPAGSGGSSGHGASRTGGRGGAGAKAGGGSGGGVDPGDGTADAGLAGAGGDPVPPARDPAIDATVVDVLAPAEPDVAPVPVADASPAPDVTVPVGARALFIIGTPQPMGTDITVRDRLAARLTVDVVVDLMATPAAATGKAVVVISSSTLLVNVDPKFADVPVPILLLEPNLMPVLQMTAAAATDHGGAPNETQLMLVGSGNPLHAGLSGTVTVFNGPGRVTWGIPAKTATKIAALVGRPTQLAIFAYPAGAQMVGRTAPAKRLAFFIQDNTTENLAPDGIKLLDAAIAWSMP